MIGAAKDKSSLPGSLTALRVLLCLLITFLLAGTRAEAFFAPPDQAPGQIAAFQPDSTGKTTTAWQYDALDSLIAANSAMISSPGGGLRAIAAGSADLSSYQASVLLGSIMETAALTVQAPSSRSVVLDSTILRRSPPRQAMNSPCSQPEVGE
jgi:hypothetical protein